MFSEFFTLEMLATFAGATMAVGVITEMFKKIGFLLQVPSQLISYIIAILVMFVGNLAIGTLNWSTAFLSLINAAVVSLASNGGYDLVKRMSQIGDDHEMAVEIKEMVALEEQVHNPDLDNG